MRTILTRLLLAAALAIGLAACSDASETSTPADDVQEDGTLTEAEAEAVATAYLGLTEDEAEALAAADGRPYRVGARDGERFALTQDYVVGRITVTIEDGVVTAATVEATDGQVDVTS